MMDAIERRAGLERLHVGGADLAQLPIGRDHGTLAAPPDQTVLTAHGKPPRRPIAPMGLY